MVLMRDFRRCCFIMPLGLAASLTCTPLSIASASELSASNKVELDTPSTLDEGELPPPRGRARYRPDGDPAIPRQRPGREPAIPRQ